MHAARALNAQRKRRQDQRLANVRRLSAASGSRSPIDSTDLERLEKLARRSNRRVNGISSPFLSRRSSMDFISRTISCLNASGVNCAYVGFALAIFGSIPLIVGTFIEIPALWEIGLTITILGLLLGIVFWCSDFLREAKGVGPVIPKEKPRIDKAKIKDMMHKPPVYMKHNLNAFEKDEVMAVELPVPYSEMQSRSEPILTLQSSEPKPFLEVDYLPQQIPEPDSPKQAKQFLQTNNSFYPSHIVSVEPELEPYPKNLLVHQEPEPYPKILRAQVETNPYLASLRTQSECAEPYSKVDMTEPEPELAESSPMRIVQLVDDSEFRDSPSLALPPSPNDTTVQIISETMISDEPVPEEKETPLTSEISPADCEPPTSPIPVVNANSPPPSASPPKTVTSLNLSNAETESEFSSVPGAVPNEVIQVVEVIPSSPNNNEQQKTEETKNE